jgi:hypothetical protein
MSWLTFDATQGLAWRGLDRSDYCSGGSCRTKEWVKVSSTLRAIWFNKFMNYQYGARTKQLIGTLKHSTKISAYKQYIGTRINHCWRCKTVHLFTHNYHIAKLARYMYTQWQRCLQNQEFREISKSFRNRSTKWIDLEQPVHAKVILLILYAEEN